MSSQLRCLVQVMMDGRRKKVGENERLGRQDLSATSSNRLGTYM